MSSKKEGRLRKTSPTATPFGVTYTDPVNCQWDTCLQQFSRITDLVQHIKKTHKLKEIKKHVCLWRNCTRNRKPLKDRYAFVTHLQTHTGEKPHICPVSSPTVKYLF